MLEFLLDGLWPLDGAPSAQMKQFNLSYICIFYAVLCVLWVFWVDN